MTLTIICPDSKTYKNPLSKALEYIGINDYQILDPAHDDVGKEFVFVLYVGKLPEERYLKLKSMSQEAWSILPPNINASPEDKKAWLEKIKEIQNFILTNKDRDHFKKIDMPVMYNLQDYLNSKKGQVIEVTLPDRRKLGIYPDSQKLKRIYDIEYHASTVVNISKLFQLFDASEVIIKEL
jgi:hypothetical protein